MTGPVVDQAAQTQTRGQELGQGQFGQTGPVDQAGKTMQDAGAPRIRDD
jgi:hypothetical protein